MLLYCFLAFVIYQPTAGIDSVSDLAESLLDPSVYNKKERPNINAGIPTTINVSIFVSSISDINEITMAFSINMFLRQTWNDPRLSYMNNTQFNQTQTLSHNLLPLLWVPDLYIRNERTKGSFHDITVPNVLLKLSPDGTVFFSQRISSSLSCPMELHNYPLDSQECEMQIESYGYSTNDEIVQWLDVEHPLEVNDIVQLPEFNITSTSTGYCTAVFSTGTFACIFAKFSLQRLFQYYLIQVYVPSILIVVLSWVSFYIDINAVPARISLGLLTVLTITTQTSGISSSLPRVSYIKAIDVWMFTNTVFVFGALIEYSIVNVLARTHKAKLDAIKKKKHEQLEMEQHNRNSAVDEKQVELTDKKTGFDDLNSSLSSSNGKLRKRLTSATLHVTDVPDDKKMSWCEHVKFNRALLVDVISRIMFPASYLLFNILYWTFYLIL